MLNDLVVNRRMFLESVATVAAGGLATSAAGGIQIPGAGETADNAGNTAIQPEAVRLNMTGVYGPWLSETVLGDRPGALSLRSGLWTDVQKWRDAAQKRVLECIAPVGL